MDGRTERRTDGQMDKASTICSPFGEHKNSLALVLTIKNCFNKRNWVEKSYLSSRPEHASKTFNKEIWSHRLEALIKWNFVSHGSLL